MEPVSACYLLSGCLGLLLLLTVVGAKQVPPNDCEKGKIICDDRPTRCCDPPERPWPPSPPLQAPPPPGTTLRQPPLQPPPVQAPPPLPIWTNWYFWVMVAAVVVLCVAGCGYWRRRKIYESSASQTLGHAHHYCTPTPSDDTPMYGPPLPFLPPTPYPAPPPYSEAARPSFDPLEQHIYDAMIAGRSLYDYYDRRHPNAYYDRYFLPDDTSSSETTSLLSYRLHRSCSSHLPPRHHHPHHHHHHHHHHSIRKCGGGGGGGGDMLAPPPYSEVAAKPELYPVVVMRGEVTEVNSIKSMGDTPPLHHHHHHHHHPPPFPPHHCHHYLYRSGSVSTPEGSQSSSYTCGAVLQSECRGGVRVSSPGCVLAMASPASSVGPHASDVSSLPPTSPPSPPAPTSPTLPPSPASRELRDVLQKISQLPGASTPPSTHPPGLPVTQFIRSRTRRPLGASLSLEVSAPSRPRSLPLNSSPLSSPPCLHDPPSPLLTTSASTPNLASAWPSPPSRTHLMASLVDDGSRVVSHAAPEPPDHPLFGEERREVWEREVSEHRYRWRVRDRIGEHLGERV
ncbi:SH3 and multiple ankyrin repeat domains protein 1-like isoform X2 [Eriocheir sinensis]|uniref:SH3 and multiple ankyrin repeat domains protein 1-like isoform X2 n=1 Tax=Eriocheir sinensis TaxID=95602 RepID=UPI0021C81742|nr:SH3 and multiple ankyrin repeat domains protein 1-like isoform X2 [Eriocheir sinensis]